MGEGIVFSNLGILYGAKKGFDLRGARGVGRGLNLKMGRLTLNSALDVGIEGTRMEKGK